MSDQMNAALWNPFWVVDSPATCLSYCMFYFFKFFQFFSYIIHYISIYFIILLSTLFVEISRTLQSMLPKYRGRCGAL